MAEQNNSKKRLIGFALATTVAVGGLGYYLLSDDSAQQQTVVVGNSDITTNLKSIDDIPGQSDDPEHNEIQKEANKINYDKSQEEGTSFVPKLVNDQVEKQEEIIEPPVETKPEPEPIKEPEPIPEPEPIVVPEVKEEVKVEIQQPEPIAQKPEIKYEVNLPVVAQEANVDENLVKIYETEIEKLQSQWDGESKSEKTLMLIEKDVSRENNGGDGEKNYSQNNDSYANNQNQEQLISMQTSSVSQGPLFVRASTIIPAVMITAVNTDEPGPVMAEIVSGPLKGARLLGQVVNAPTDVTDNIQKATIQFNTIQKNDWDQSYQVNVFAIDPNTSRTALASSVDNHYFRRYGLGLAAAFVEGLGDAYSNIGKTVTHTDNATIVSMGQSAKEINRSALGNVGKKLGQEIGKIADVPATIYVDAGETIGLLFMSDF